MPDDQPTSASEPVTLHQPQEREPGGPALRLTAVMVNRSGAITLEDVSWTVGPGERWVLLGPNGSGKTTIMQLASGYLHPTRGTVEILGHRLGRVDVRRLRQRIGLVSASISKMLIPTLTATELVVSAANAALEPWWDRYDLEAYDRARDLLAASGLEDAADRAYGVLSEGERQQVLLARSLMRSPELLLLDEPAAGLDISGRERLLGRLTRLATAAGSPPTVLITHHVEEIPAGFDQVMLLSGGHVVASGPADEVLTDANLSRTYGMELRVRHDQGRWSCRAAGS